MSKIFSEQNMLQSLSGSIPEGETFVAGLSPDGKLVEIVELPQNAHPFFVAVQFHPEFKSRPNRPHPLFNKFIKVSSELKEKSHD